MAGTFKQSNYINHTTSEQCAVGEEKLYANANIKKGSLKDKTGMYQTPPVQHTEREEKLEVAKATKSRSNNPKKINLEQHDQRSNKNIGFMTSGENKREKTRRNSPLNRASSETGSIFSRPFTGHKPNHNSFPKSAPYVTMKQKLRQTKSSSNRIGPIFTSSAVCDGKETDKAKKSEKASLTLATEPVKDLGTLAQSKENCKLQCTPSSRRLSLTDGKGETLQKLPDKCETPGDRQLDNDCVLNQKVVTIDDHNRGYCLGRAICPLREGRRFVDLKTPKTNSSWEELEPMLTASPAVWNAIEDQMVDSGRLLVEQFGKCIVMPNNQSNAKSTKPDRLLKTKVSPVVGCNNKAIYLLSLKELSGQSVQARSHLYSETSGDSFVGKMLINDFESASQTPCPSNTYILQNLKPAKPFCDDKKPTVQMNCDFASMTRGTQTGRFNRKSCDSCLCPFTVLNQKGVGTKSHSKPTYPKAIIAAQEQSGQTNEDSDHCLIVDGNYDYEPLAPYTASVGEQKRIEKRKQSVFELVKNKKQIKSSSVPKTKQLINKTCDCHAPLLEKSKKHLRRHRSTPRRQVSLQDLSNDRHKSQHLQRPKSITREAFGNFELKSNHIDLPVKLRKVNNTSLHVSPKNFQKHLHHVDTPTTHTEKSNKPVGDRPNESSGKLYMLNSRTENEIDQKVTSIQHWLQSASFDHTSTGTLKSIPAIEDSTLINPIKHIGEPNPIDHKTHESTQLQKDEHATDANASGTDLSPTPRTIHVVERMLHKSIKETEREADKGTSVQRESLPDDANAGRSNTKGQTLWPESAIRSDTPLRKRGSAPCTNIALARGSPRRVAAAVGNSAGRKSKSRSNGRLFKQTRPYQNAFISMRDHSVRIRRSCSRILITFCVTLVILESVALWVYIMWYLANTSLTSVGGFFSLAQEESDLHCDESDPKP